MTGPAVVQGVERLLLRQVAAEMMKAAMPDSPGAAGDAYQDMFASVLADAVAGEEPRETGRP